VRYEIGREIGYKIEIWDMPTKATKATKA